MAKRRCAFCKKSLPADARPNRRYCDEDCRRHRTRPPEVAVGEVSSALEAAIATATKEQRIGPLDAAAVAAIRVLARKVDEEQARWDYCLAWAREQPAGSRPKPPPSDNTLMPTFLNYCSALGLVPSGRKDQPKEPGRAGSLGGHLSAVKKPS